MNRGTERPVDGSQAEREERTVTHHYRRIELQRRCGKAL
jgi:hypothetical protein